MAISTAIDPTAAASVVGIQVQFQDLRAASTALLSQRVAIVGQGATFSVYSLDKLQITSAVQAGTVYGFGSPIHLAALQLLPSNGDGVGTIPVTVYPLEDAPTSVQAVGDITFSGTQIVDASYRVLINNILSEEFVIAVGDIGPDIAAAITHAINSSLSVPVAAFDNTNHVALESKWQGESANDIVFSVIGSTTAGTVFATTQLTGGLVNPDIDPVLTQVGDIWETLFLNCLNVSDTVTLNKFQTFGEGRWGALTKKPCMVFSGQTIADATTASTISDSRELDRINAQLVAPGCDNLPFVVAARELARIAVVANSNPPVNYQKQLANLLVPGEDSEQWDYNTQDFAVKRGSSTTTVTNNIIALSDIITFYHPFGDTNPAYRYVVDIVKISNAVYNTNLIFDTAEWAGAPLLPDGSPTSNPAAKTPSDAKTVLSAMLDGLSDAAIISNVTAAKESIVAEISSLNPKRLDISYTIQLVGNLNIISIDLNFGFFFGA